MTSEEATDQAREIAAVCELSLTLALLTYYCTSLLPQPPRSSVSHPPGLALGRDH